MRWIQTVENYIEVEERLDEESFMIASQNSNVMPVIGLNALGRRAIQGKHRIKIWSWLTSYMDVRFNLDK